jgi:energy-coupling factor transport system ATP-binding protein
VEQSRNLDAIAIDIQHVSFTYPPPMATKALRDVTAQIDKGAVVALIGQNGSGKTTLARCLSGFLRPQAGAILVRGKNMHRIPPSRQALHVGYVFQNPGHQLFRDTVWEEAAFGLENLKVSGEVIEQKVTDILRDLDLLQHRDAHPHRLAKGDKQRLAVASIAIMEPPVIIVDEPTTGQDPQRARDVMELLIHLNKGKGSTILVISHAMELVAEYATRAIALCQGMVLLDGPVSEVFGHPEILSKTYVEPPPIVQLGIALGLTPLPLTVEETTERLLERLRQ